MVHMIHRELSGNDENLNSSGSNNVFDSDLGILDQKVLLTILGLALRFFVPLPKIDVFGRKRKKEKNRKIKQINSKDLKNKLQVKICDH